MKRFSNNDFLINDISRSAYSYKPLFQESTQLNNLKQNISIFTNASMKPKQINKRDVTTFQDMNQEINKIHLLTQDIKNKNNENNRLKDELSKLNHKIDSLNKEINDLQKNSREVKVLKEKLTDYYNLQKETNQLKIQKQNDDKTILMLKKIILKQQNKYKILESQLNINHKNNIFVKTNNHKSNEISPDNHTINDTINSNGTNDNNDTNDTINDNVNDTNDTINDTINDNVNGNVNVNVNDNVNGNLLRVIQSMKSDCSEESILKIFKELNINISTEINSEIINSIIKKL